MKRSTLLVLMAASMIASCSAAPSDPTAPGNRPGDFNSSRALNELRHNPERWELNAQEGTAVQATTALVGLHTRTTVEICYLDETTGGVLDCIRPTSKKRRRLARAFRKATTEITQ